MSTQAVADELFRRHMEASASVRRVMAKPRKVTPWVGAPVGDMNDAVDHFIQEFQHRQDKKQGLRALAHDSGDGETIYHCPFCGSGAVTGGSDGTVSCDFCNNNFTVQVQPEFKQMPQTVQGEPYNIPGMPGGGPDAGTQPGADDVPQPDAEPIVDAPSGGAEGAPPFEEEDKADKKPVPPQFKQSHLLTQDGYALPVGSFHRHLALRFADDRNQVLADVRAANQRSN